MTFRFEVAGKPVPQGSMQAFVVAGKARVTHRKAGPLIEYREMIRRGAESCGLPPIDGPVQVKVIFSLPRPKIHYGTGKNATKLKQFAPLAPVTRPDMDKLFRSVGDAITGICFKDDSQIVRLIAEKVYGDPATTVEVKPL